MFDKDYETNVKPTYVLPSSYVRHAKKVGEEADVSVDYCADQDDMVHYIAALLALCDMQNTEPICTTDVPSTGTLILTYYCH